MNPGVSFIGIEASCCFGPRSGVGYYTKYLLEGLAGLAGPGRAGAHFQLVLLAHRATDGAFALPSLPQWHFPCKPVWFQVFLTRAVNQLALDLVHFPNYVTPWKWERPYVLTIHDLSLLRDPRWHPGRRRMLLGHLLERSARNADMVLCASRSVREDILDRLQLDPSCVRVTPLAAGPSFSPASEEQIARLRSKYTLPPEYILYLGNIEPRKNLPRLIAAWERVCSAESNRLPLVLAGRPAWLYEEILQAVRASPYSRLIYLTGYVPEEDLPALYSGATLFVYPSLFEGFGLPVLEAMACGVPVLASGIKPLREICGEAAVLVDPKDTEALAAGLRRLLERDSWRRSLGEKGLQASSRYTWEETARKTLAAYREAVERRRGAPLKPVGEPRASLQQLSWSERELALLKTVLYSSLFDYPLQTEEVCRGLIESSESESSLLETYRKSPVLRQAIDFRNGYFFPRGQEKLLEQRKRREAWTLEVLRAHRRVLRLVCLIPFTRMVALSGSAAHLNLDRNGDMDLFIVTGGNRVWSAAVATLLLTKLLGCRKTVCFNFVLSDRRLRIEQQDLFNANQMIHLKPLMGGHLHWRFLKENPFVFRFYPNFSLPQPSPLECEPGPLLRAVKYVAECFLRLGLVQVQEAVCRLAYSTYLKTKSDAWSSPQEVVLEKDYLKLHTQSHRLRVLKLFDQALLATLARTEGVRDD